MALDRVTILCFVASYGVALVLELWHLVRPRPILRLAGLAFGLAGLLAHTIFLAVQRLPLSSRQGSLLFLAWIVAIFYAYGALHHRKVSWAIFVLPVVLGLVGLAVVFGRDVPEAQDFWLFRLLSFRGEAFWGAVHATLLLLAAVGMCVGFVASIMYLVQSRRLRTKSLSGHTLQLFSLERLEEMHRRAIILTFPLLTFGVIVGMVLMAQGSSNLRGWTDLRVLAAGVLWIVFALLVYVRYSLHIRGRRVAILTIVAFVLLLVTFALPHTPLSGGGAP